MQNLSQISRAFFISANQLSGFLKQYKTPQLLERAKDEEKQELARYQHIDFPAVIQTLQGFGTENEML